MDEDATADTLFCPSATFRRLPAKYRTRGRTSSAMYTAREPAQRREAADTAVALVAGLERYRTDFLYQLPAPCQTAPSAKKRCARITMQRGGVSR